MEAGLNQLLYIGQGIKGGKIMKNTEIHNIKEHLKTKYTTEELKNFLSEGYKAFTPTGKLIENIASTDDVPIEHIICCIEAD